jgi:hypothetical protein
VYRDEDLRRLVATLPCVGCGATGNTQAAHSNLLRHGKGKSIKATDAAIMALCHDYCHPELDQGDLTEDERERLTHQYIADTYILLIETGKLRLA